MPDWKPEILKHLNGLNLSALREIEIVEELTEHLQDRYAELLSGGSTSEEAHAIVLAELDDSQFLTTEISRIENKVNIEPVNYAAQMGWGARMKSGFLQDVIFSFRMMAKKPAFTVIAVLVLALGIGGNTALFTVVNAVILQPLPYKDPSRLVMMFETEPQLPKAPLTGPDFLDWKEQNQSFEMMAAGTSGNATLTGAGEPVRLETVPVSANYFELLGTLPAIGRPFTAEEDKPGINSTVVILTNNLWRQRFGSDPGIVGKTITLDGKPQTVVGVMPEQFIFPAIWGLKPDAFVPLNLIRNENARGSHWLFGIGRLKPGVSVQQAQTEIAAIAERNSKQYPATNVDIGADLVSLQEHIVGNARSSLLTLFGAVAFVLLIACANVANLLLTRTVSRQKEFAIRISLGANRFRLIRQLLTESVILSLMGGLAGFVLAVLAKNTLVAMSPSRYLPRAAEIHLSTNVLGFTLLISLITGMLFGLVPSMQASRLDLNEMLKDGSAAGGGVRSRYLRSGLVIVEIALGLILLIGSGLMIRSMQHLLNVDLGFNTTHILTGQISLVTNNYSKPDQREQFFKSLLEKLNSLPGVEGAAMASQLPLGGGSNGVIQIEGRPPVKGFGGPLVQNTSITADYFKVMGIPFVKGRPFDGSERSDSTNVVIINQTLAKQFWPDEDPIGKRFAFGLANTKPVWREIIGVVADIHQHGFVQKPIAEFYAPYPQWPSTSMGLAVKSSIEPTALIKSIQEKAQELDKSIPIYGASTMDQLAIQATLTRRFQTWLMGVFGGLALILSAVGIYGVMSYSVAQQTREIGIRMALGAQPRDVIKLIVGHGALLSVIGIVLGLIGARTLTSVMETMLFEIKSTDQTTFTVVPVLLLVVGLLACYIPARRALRVDPMTALRSE